MAGSKKPGPMGTKAAGRSLEDGTNVRGFSPRPGSVHARVKKTFSTIPGDVAHYDVRKGDSLWSIAAKHLGDGRLCQDLAKLNRILPDGILRIGQRLIIPDFQRCDMTVAYMLSEMLTNAQSPEAKSIKDAIHRSKQSKNEGLNALEDIKKTKWYELFRMYGNQEIFNATMQQSGIAMAEAKARWFLQVRTGGPWNHKPILKKMYESMPSPPRPFGAMGKAFHFPIRGDLFHEYYYDVWSNIHYGYVGAKCGFEEPALQGGAASGLPGAGDNDEGDIISIKIGIDLWKSSGLGLKADTLQKAITSHATDYIAARNHEIKQGMKVEKATNVVISDNDYK